MEIEKFGNERFPTTVKDPFNKKSVKRISVSFYESFLNGEWISRGYVEFKNNSTSGKQEFTAETFDEVVIQIKSFINNELK